MNKQKLLIFDFDDTLTNNTERDAHSFLHIIKKFNLVEIEKQKIIKWRKLGLLSNVIIQKLINSDNQLLFKKCVNERLKFLDSYESYTKYVKLKLCTIKILSKLSNENHILTLNSIQSNNKNFQNVLKYFGINHYFQKIVTSDSSISKYSKEKNRIEIKSEFYKQIISEFKFNKKNVIVIGNLASDIIPAENLNLKSLMIKGSFGFDDHLCQTCDQIDKLKQILNFL